MDFMAILSLFLTWQFIALCVGITAVTFIFRTVVEYLVLNNPKLPGNSASRFWRDLALPLFPVLLGILFAISAKSFPYPGVINEFYSKFLFGISAGLFSPTLYRVIKAFLWKNASNAVSVFPVIGGTPNVLPPNGEIVTPSTPAVEPAEPKI